MKRHGIGLALLLTAFAAEAFTISSLNTSHSGNATAGVASDFFTDSGGSDEVCADGILNSTSCPASGDQAANLASSLATAGDFTTVFSVIFGQTGDGGLAVIGGAGASGNSSVSFMLDENAFYTFEASLTPSCSGIADPPVFAQTNLSIATLNVSESIDCSGSPVNISQSGQINAGLHSVSTSGFAELVEPSGTASFDMSYTLTITVVPVPAAAWLFGSALGLLGWIRRKKT